MKILSRSAALTVFLALGGTAFCAAQSVLPNLSPSTREELNKLSASDRAALSRELGGGENPGSDGNDFLCMRWGCVGGTLDLGWGDWSASPDAQFLVPTPLSNPGWFTAIEAAAPVPYFQPYGIGAQASASYGTYNLNGHVPLFISNFAAAQRQEFYSVGLFRRPDPFGPWTSRWGFGAVYDFSLNQNAGTLVQYYAMQQWRLKASYDLTAAHEVGVWAAIHSGAATTVTGAIGTFPLQFRPIDQFNLFYKYDLPRGGNAYVYAGPGVGSHLPMNVNYDGLLWTLGAGFALPIAEHWGAFADLGYGLPRALGPGSVSARATTASSIQAGFRFFWGGNAQVRDDTGRHWMPYIPAPNNGTFITQTNLAI